MLIKKIFIITFISLVISCTNEINIDLPDINPKPVINCIFTPDSLFKLNISKTKKITDTNIYYINDAEVNLYSNNKLLGKFNNFSNGDYVLPLNSEENTDYEIRVSIPNYKTITADSNIPAKIKILNATCAFKRMDEYGDCLYEINIEFNDPADAVNYYELLLFFNHYETINSISNIDNMDIFNFIVNDPILISEGDLDYEPSTFFFSDNLFNGKTAKIKLGYYGGYDPHYMDGQLVQEIKHLYVILRSVSKSYYNYRKYWTRHSYNQNTNEHFDDPETLLFFGESLPMYTNIKNGYGIFAGYSSDIKKIKFIP
ncbi:MAG: DUF4249 domain-containing protein [Bacteroidetes bacterium]|nr:DUF4249 domain-containing protein [Bacteroidota bacterium]